MHRRSLFLILGIVALVIFLIITIFLYAMFTGFNPMEFSESEVIGGVDFIIPIR